MTNEEIITLPPDVIQFLKAHVTSSAAYTLLRKYGDKKTSDYARKIMAVVTIKNGEAIWHDRETGEEFMRKQL